MKNNDIPMFTQSCVAVRIDTQEIIFSGSRFYCEAMREGNGGTPSVNPNIVAIMTKDNYNNLLVVQSSHGMSSI